MAKIIAFSEETVQIGTPEGELLEIPRSDCLFADPVIGEKVEVFRSGERLVVQRPLAPEGTFSGIPTAPQVTEQKYGAEADDLPPASSVWRNPNPKRVSKVAYVVLALLLGGVGAHKFYSGHISAALVYLIFFWTSVPAILALIDAVMGILAPADKEGRILV
ncbi:MAG: TM2 domain-containing protein [Actinomycetaceae bacterium]|nr:TM2 domain-containing protein [Actinomycetaceae bacterium]